MTALTILGIMGLGTTEILLILGIVLLMFGGRKIPELMKGLGKGVKEFKDASANNSPAQTTIDDKTNTPLNP
ncbi:MAG: twin-arginine translocase TatA/TatE family subunit [Sphingobacteriales bacterium JAD_PAG50586_3]|nr:MAG: twin-arginine translocase TatA/TatE family subunit [Sphingobacteriales bacterium JAD_PAG50586_3]